MKRLLLFVCICISLCGCKNSAVPTGSRHLKNDDFYNTLSNKTQGWGFRRTENGPEFTENQIRQMAENDCIYKESGEEKNIYLTFDEGYENGYTSIILDTLRKKNVPAAFFVTGPYVKSNPDLIKRMVKEGHIVGNHTVNHPSLPDIKSTEALIKELTELDRLIFGAGGGKFKYLRPPKGEYSERTLTITRDYGYTNVFWSQAYVDWNDNVDSKTAFEKITKDLHPGCVLLLHAVSKGNADALENVINYAQKSGYTFKSLDEFKK